MRTAVLADMFNERKENEEQGPREFGELSRILEHKPQMLHGTGMRLVHDCIEPPAVGENTTKTAEETTALC